MTDLIRYLETTDASASPGDARDALALRFDPSRRVTLRFRLELSAPRDLEALRYARRAMIREERTRGLDWDEPSMEDPTFTPSEIRWFVLASQANWCRRKVAELVERANRARAELDAQSHPE
jgi:hypothetical protein